MSASYQDKFNAERAQIKSLLNGHQYKEAAVIIARVDKQKRNRKDFLLLKATCESGLKQFSQALKTCEAAMSAVEEMIHRNGKDDPAARSEVLRLKARILRENREFPKALAIYDSLLKPDAKIDFISRLIVLTDCVHIHNEYKSLDGNAKQTAQERLSKEIRDNLAQAWQLMVANKYGEAAKIIDALEERFKRADCMIAKSVLEQKQKRYAAAVNFCDKALTEIQRLKDQHALFRMTLHKINCLVLAGRVAEAKKLREAFEKDFDKDVVATLLAETDRVIYPVDFPKAKDDKSPDTFKPHMDRALSLLDQAEGLLNKKPVEQKLVDSLNVQAARLVEPMYQFAQRRVGTVGLKIRLCMTQQKFPEGLEICRQGFNAASQVKDRDLMFTYRLQAANFMRKLNRHGEAMGIYEILINEYADKPELLRTATTAKGYCAEEMGDSAAVKDSKEKNAETIRADLDKAWACLEKSDAEGALKLVTPLAKFSKRLDVGLTLARCYSDLGQLPKTLEVLNQHAAYSKDDNRAMSKVRLAQGIALSSSGDMEAALLAFTEAEAKAETDKQKIDALFSRMKMLNEMGRKAEAQAIKKRLREEEAKISPSTLQDPRFKFYSQLSAALTCQDAGEYNRAALLLDHLESEVKASEHEKSKPRDLKAELQPDERELEFEFSQRYFRVKLAKAMLYNVMGRYEDALQITLDLEKLDVCKNHLKHLADVLLCQARSYGFLGLPDQAKSIYAKVDALYQQVTAEKRDAVFYRNQFHLQLQMGRHLQLVGNFDEAIQCFEKMLTVAEYKNRKHMEKQIRMAKAICHAKEERFDKALHEYEQLIQLFQEKPIDEKQNGDLLAKSVHAPQDVVLAWARCLEEQNQFDTAKKVYESNLLRFPIDSANPSPESIAVRLAYANCLYNMNQWKAVSERLVPLLDLKDINDNAVQELHTLLALCLAEMGDLKEALKFFDGLKQSFRENHDFVLKTLLSRAHCLTNAGRYDAAHEVYRELLNDFQHNLNAVFRILSAQIVLYRQQKKFDESIALSQQLMDRCKSLPNKVLDAKMQLAITLREAGRLDEAKKLFDVIEREVGVFSDEKAVPNPSKSPSHLHVRQRRYYASRALYFRQVQQYDKAKQCYEMILQSFPHNCSAQLEFAVVAGMTDKAYSSQTFKLFEVFIRKYPHRPEGRLELGHYLKRVGEYEKALDTFRNNTVLFPYHLGSHIALARHYLEMEGQKDFDTIIREVKKLQEKFPYSIELSLVLIEANLMRPNIQGAKALHEQALLIHKDNVRFKMKAVDLFLKYDVAMVDTDEKAAPIREQRPATAAVSRIVKRGESLSLQTNSVPTQQLTTAPTANAHRDFKHSLPSAHAAATITLPPPTAPQLMPAASSAAIATRSDGELSGLVPASSADARAHFDELKDCPNEIATTLRFMMGRAVLASTSNPLAQPGSDEQKMVGLGIQKLDAYHSLYPDRVIAFLNSQFLKPTGIHFLREFALSGMLNRLFPVSDKNQLNFNSSFLIQVLKGTHEFVRMNAAGMNNLYLYYAMIANEMAAHNDLPRAEFDERVNQLLLRYRLTVSADQKFSVYSDIKRLIARRFEFKRYCEITHENRLGNQLLRDQKPNDAVLHFRECYKSAKEFKSYNIQLQAQVIRAQINSVMQLGHYHAANQVVDERQNAILYFKKVDGLINDLSRLTALSDGDLGVQAAAKLQLQKISQPAEAVVPIASPPPPLAPQSSSYVYMLPLTAQANSAGQLVVVPMQTLPPDPSLVLSANNPWRFQAAPTPVLGGNAAAEPSNVGGVRPLGPMGMV